MLSQAPEPTFKYPYNAGNDDQWSMNPPAAPKRYKAEESRGFNVVT
jgi:hypothetical protein